MRLHRCTPFFLLVTAALADAQQSPWKGECGPPDASFSRLTLSDCTANTSKFILEHHAGHQRTRPPPRSSQKLAPK